MTALFEMVGAGFVVIMGLMTLLWIVYFFQRNATLVDLGWTACFIFAAWIYLLLGDGFFPRRFLMTVMVSVWAGRLFWHLWQRYDRRAEDPRYTKIRQRLGDDALGFKFLLLFIFQGVIALILTLPFLLSASNTASSWTASDGWGVVVWFLGVAGEALADRQLSDFKKNHPGKLCQTGLWKWSRHPNYFFEFITWIGFALFACSAPFGLLAFISPVIMYYLLVHVSGIPLSEEQALKTKGAAYLEYQKSTSSFIPWFKS